MRDYRPLLDRLSSLPADASRAGRMRAVCDLIWEAFGLGRAERPAYSWIGFYEKTSGLDEMILVERRDKPACSPIGLHGMCGRGWAECRAILIDDVATLGGNYIACDPKDLSEIVVPVINADGSCWGVLDGDSYERAAFDERDVAGLTAMVSAAGLSVEADASGRGAAERVLRL
jgi:putative methionine-R-sulfoxide reductase with GAF domain